MAAQGSAAGQVPARIEPMPATPYGGRLVADSAWTYEYKLDFCTRFGAVGGPRTTRQRGRLLGCECVASCPGHGAPAPSSMTSPLANDGHYTSSLITCDFASHLLARICITPVVSNIAVGTKALAGAEPTTRQLATPPAEQGSLSRDAVEHDEVPACRDHEFAARPDRYGADTAEVEGGCGVRATRRRPAAVVLGGANTNSVPTVFG
jgi:hypothetical protein